MRSKIIGPLFSAAAVTMRARLAIDAGGHGDRFYRFSSFSMNVPDTRPQTEEDWQARVYEALDAFTAGAPIDEFDLIAGRGTQIDDD